MKVALLLSQSLTASVHTYCPPSEAAAFVPLAPVRRRQSISRLIRSSQPASSDAVRDTSPSKYYQPSRFSKVGRRGRRTKDAWRYEDGQAPPDPWDLFVEKTKPLRQQTQEEEEEEEEVEAAEGSESDESLGGVNLEDSSTKFEDLPPPSIMRSGTQQYVHEQQKATARRPGTTPGMIGGGSRGGAGVASPPGSPHSPVEGSSVRWIRGGVIGQGQLGRVYEGMEVRTGRRIAVKELLVDEAADKKFIDQHMHEINLYQELRHEHIVSYLGHDKIDGCVYIYMEFMPGGSLAQMLTRFGAFEEETIATYTRHVLEGLKYLHDRNIMHRDVKGGNILVDTEGNAKLADFGCSRKAERSMATTIKGTLPWTAPEVIHQKGYGRKADIWSLGGVVVEMAQAHHPWDSFDNQMAAMLKIGFSQETPNIPKHLSHVAKDFLERCFQRDPDRRSTAEDLLTHPFITRRLDDPLPPPIPPSQPSSPTDPQPPQLPGHQQQPEAPAAAAASPSDGEGGGASGLWWTRLPSKLAEAGGASNNAAAAADAGDAGDGGADRGWSGEGSDGCTGGAS
mmetsp:Transcript_6070/g.17320  ORF Transcript_6070/g.17320 Transcript_6070/m.17320 type:complete len:565 (+) Transcript_6070:34-1728(+)